MDHRGERAVEGVLEGVKQFTALRLFAGDYGTVERQVTDLFRREQALRNHAVHERAHGGIGPGGLWVEFFLDRRRRAGFMVPDGLDDRPFRLGQFDGRLGHGATLLDICRDVKRNLYNCKFCAGLRVNRCRMKSRR